MLGRGQRYGQNGRRWPLIVVGIAALVMGAIALLRGYPEAFIALSLIALLLLGMEVLAALGHDADEARAEEGVRPQKPKP